MTKYEFLSALRARISSLPREDADRTIDYYSEMIDDRVVEGGGTEEAAVAALGSMDDIVASVFADYPQITTQPAPKKDNSTVTLAIVLTSIIWAPVLFSVAVTLLSLFVSAIAVFASGFLFMAVMIPWFAQGNVALGLVYFGAGLFCIGFGALMFVGTFALTKFTLWLIKRLWALVKGAKA